MEDLQRIPAFKLTSEEYSEFLLGRLNRIYCAKTKLEQKRPEIGRRANFADLRQAISDAPELIEDVAYSI